MSRDRGRRPPERPGRPRRASELSRHPVEPRRRRSPGPAATGRPIRNAELDRLATGAALDAVLGTAARLRMPDLIDFLR